MTDKVLAELEPNIIWDIFEQITRVPRPSKKEEKIRAWIKRWAKKNNIKVAKEDSTGNILLTKEASKGYEDVPTLIIQAHMDMVCQKLPNTEINFETDPIPIKIEENKVVAKGTTLGADNGIGMAYGLAALIDPDLEHGPLEVLLTVDEETGLTGAFAIKKGFFHGKYLLNVDSEEEGKITISSAGGGDSKLFFPIKFQKYDDHTGLKITIAGLQGGHSGTDIDLPRLNAIKIGADLLNQIVSDGAIVSNLSGGTVHNAIPRDFICEIIIPEKIKKNILAKIEAWKKHTLEIGRKTEPKLAITIEKTESDKGITPKKSEEITELLIELEHGPLAYSKKITGLVQTSSNLAIVETTNKEIEIHLSTRSSKAEGLEETRKKIKNLGEKMGCKVEQGKAYPGWEPKPKAPFVTLVKEKYEEVINEEVELLAIHAGLECGLFSDLDKELQIVSLGPNIHNAHSPEEFVEIPSVGVLWKVIKKIISDLKEIKG